VQKAWLAEGSDDEGDRTRSNESEISARRERRAAPSASRSRPTSLSRDTNLIFTQDMKSRERPTLPGRARGGNWDRGRIPSRAPNYESELARPRDSVARISSLSGRGINQFSHVPARRLDIDRYDEASARAVQIARVSLDLAPLFFSDGRISSISRLDRAISRGL